LTNKRKHVIIVIQGKESQRSQPLKSAGVRRNTNSLHGATSSEELRLVAIEKTPLIPQKKLKKFLTKQKPCAIITM
jgi:hypothetical protein